MEEIKNQIAKYLANFIAQTSPLLMTIGLIVAVVSISVAGLFLIFSKNEDQRAIVMVNIKYLVAGVILLGCVVPVLGYLIYRFA